MEDDHQDVIDQTLTRIRQCTEISDAEREKLLEFYNEMERHNREVSKNDELSGIRINGYLGDVHRLAKNVGHIVKALNPETGDEAITQIITYTTDEFDGATLDTVHTSLRTWGRIMAEDDDIDDDDHPERFDRASLGNREDDQPAPKPSEVLWWSDCVEMIIVAVQKMGNWRTAALIAFLWATGARPMSEAWELTFGDIDDRGDHLLVTLPEHGKTVGRTIRIDVGAPLIRKWMYEEHPAQDTERGPTSDTYLWTLLDENRLMDYQDIRRTIKRCAEKADITKPHNPAHFRKSRASVLARSRWVTQRDLEYHFGWVRGSRVAAHYIAEFGEHSRKHIAKADGADVEIDEDRDPIVPVVCDNCGEYSPRHRETCLFCPGELHASLGSQQPTGPDVDDDARLLDLIVDGEVTADHLHGLKQLRPIIERRGEELFNRLDDYIEHAEQISDD